MEQLWLLDASLTLAGNRLSSRLFGIQGLGDKWNWISRLVITASLWVTAWMDAEASLSSRAVLDILSKGMIQIVLISFAVHRRSIQQMMQELISASTTEILTRVRCVTAILVAAHLVYMTAGAVMWGYSFCFTHSDLRSTLIRLAVNLPSLAPSVILLFPAYYAVVLWMISKRDQRLLQDAARDAASGRLDARRRLKECKWMQRTIQLFDDCFNVVPLVVLGFVFISVPGVVIQARRDAADDSPVASYNKAVFVVFHVIVFADLLLLTIGVARFKGRVVEAVDELVDCLQELRHSDSASQALEREVRRLQEQRLTGGYLFTLQPSLLLSFAGAVISYTVLVLQLHDSSKSSTPRQLHSNATSVHTSSQ